MRKAISVLLLLMLAISASAEIRTLDITIFGMD
jgi:hypothetical protein